MVGPLNPLTTKLDVETREFIITMEAAKFNATKAENKINDVIKKVQLTRRRIREANAEARRLEFITGRSRVNALAGFGGASLKLMAEGTRGAVFALGSTAVFTQIIGETSPLSSALTQGLSGLAVAGPVGGVLGLVSGVITGIIGEAQMLNQRIEEVERRLKDERKIRIEQQRALSRLFEEQTRQNTERLEKLESRLNLGSEDLRIQTLRLMAQQRVA